MLAIGFDDFVECVLCVFKEELDISFCGIFDVIEELFGLFVQVEQSNELVVDVLGLDTSFQVQATDLVLELFVFHLAFVHLLRFVVDVFSECCVCVEHVFHDFDSSY